MTQVARKPSVLVYETQQFQSLAEVFSGLGSSCDYVSTPQDFLSKLTSSAYSGVCLVTKSQEITGLQSIFEELEARSLMEGLRTVLVIVRSAGQGQIFANSKLPWLVQFQFSFLRDIIEVDAEPSALERDFATRRIAFATQFDSRNPFVHKFSILSRWKTNAEVAVPARLSWFNETQNMLGIECGARIAGQTSLRVLLQINSQSVTLVGVVKENLPEQLRFNFGNSLALELLESSSTLLKRLIRSELSDQVIRRDLRRAFIVTRSVALRQKVVRAFSKNDIDCRIPLVKRNILADLPLLAPHFIIFEDRVLEELVERDGDSVYANIRSAAGSNSCIAVCGDTINRISKLSGIFDTISHPMGVEAAIETWILGQTSLIESETGEKRTWFRHGSRTGRVTAIVEEKTNQISMDGVVIRGQNQYRMWSSLEISIPGTGIQFVGKAVSSALSCDSFRSQSSVSVNESPNLAYITSLTRSAELTDEVTKHLRAQLGILAAVSNSAAYADVSSSQNPSPTVSENRGTDAPPIATPIFYRATPILVGKEFEKALPKKAFDLSLNSKKIVILIVVLVAAALVLKFLSQYSGGEGKSYSDSFRALFEIHGK